MFFFWFNEVSPTGLRPLGSTDGDTEPSVKAPRQAGKSSCNKSNNRPDTSSGTRVSQINRLLGVCFALKSGSRENGVLHFCKMVFAAHDLVPSTHRVAKVLPKAKPVIWRSADHPIPGTIYRLPDDMTLQRGITYTFLPDGRSIRVPAMNRLDVRAASHSHQEKEDDDIVQALQQILSGKRGGPSFDGKGRAKQAADRERGPAPRRDVHGEGMRGMPVDMRAS